MRRWKLEDAKNRFSEVVRLALAQGPQRVTRRGEDAVVIISAEEYEHLLAPPDLVDSLRSSPLAVALAEGELNLDRSPDTGRDVVV